MKRSRTNTQAIATPITALIAATLSESHSDNQIAWRAPGTVTARQKVRRPIDTCQRQNSTPAPLG